MTRLVAILAVGLMALGALIVGGVLWLDRGPDHPDEWDPDVEDLVAFVEDERGLEFEHPVYVDFLSEEDFEKEVTQEESDLSEEDKEELEQTTGLMRALGLIDDDVDLLKQVNDLTGGGVLGVYDYEDERIRVRGEDLTPAVEATLVHELTHALQDQHFDLEDKSKDLEDDESGASAAWDALVEGDANRIERAWEEDLSAKEARALEKDRAKQRTDVERKIKDVPPFLQTSISAPYVFGEGMLALAVEIDGDDAVDDLFEDPPTSEENILDPWTLIADDEDAMEVEKPDLTGKDDEFDAGTFGAPSLAFVLAERIDPKQALRAADGWGGDQYVAFERGARTCIRIDYRGDTRRDVAELRTALRQWIQDGPAGTATVRDLGPGLRLESCDPGRKATGGNGGSKDALNFATARVAVALQGLQGGGSERQARCLGARFVDEFTSAELRVLFSGQQPDASVVERARSIGADCA